MLAAMTVPRNRPGREDHGSHHVHGVVVDGVTRDAQGERLVWGILSDLDLVGAAAATERAHPVALSAVVGV